MAIRWMASCFLVMVLLAPGQVEGQTTESSSLDEHLQVFAPLLGKTFRGAFADSTPENPKYDVSHWERAMNGKAVRILHSVNDGEYGGETIIMWDSAKQKLGYWYFTTAGFHTEGTMEIGEKEWTSTEKVVGNANGITEVKATTKLIGDTKMTARSQYLLQGKWEKGHEIDYAVAEDAKVIFK